MHQLIFAGQARIQPAAPGCTPGQWRDSLSRPNHRPYGKLNPEIEDLRGKVFAFTDPISFTSRVYPTYLLQTLGEQPETFFRRIFFTYSHDDAIHAVADGVADGASVDSLVLDFALKHTPELAQQIRVIHTSPPFGMPPVVISPNLRPQTRAELESILLNMHLDQDGLAALQALGYDKFAKVSTEDYLSAEQIESQVSIGEITP